MPRKIQVGDFIRLQLTDQYGDYLVQEISSNEIKVLLRYPKTSDIVVTIKHDGKKWDFVEVTQPHTITFINSEAYTELTSLESRLLSLPPENITQIAMSLPINDLLNVCQLNSNLNALLCNSNDFWR